MIIQKLILKLVLHPATGLVLNLSAVRFSISLLFQDGREGDNIIALANYSNKFMHTARWAVLSVLEVIAASSIYGYSMRSDLSSYTGKKIWILAKQLPNELSCTCVRNWMG